LEVSIVSSLSWTIGESCVALKKVAKSMLIKGYDCNFQSLRLIIMHFFLADIVGILVVLAVTVGVPKCGVLYAFLNRNFLKCYS